MQFSNGYSAKTIHGRSECVSQVFYQASAILSKSDPSFDQSTSIDREARSTTRLASLVPVEP